MAEWQRHMTPEEKAEFDQLTAIQDAAREAAIAKRVIRNRAYQRKLYQERQSA